MCSESYRNLGNYFRKLIKTELSTGEYPNFRSPSSHVDSNPCFQDAKFRFDILPRQNILGGNGSHDFNIGHLEISLFLAALPKSRTFADGINFPKGSPYRIVCGTMASVEPLPEAIMDSISEHWSSLRRCLMIGDYGDFVKSTMEAVHAPIAEFKELSKDPGFLRD